MPRNVRAVPRALVIAAALLFVARVVTEVYEHRHPPAWADLVQWKTPAEAEAILTMESRVVVYEFSASWCEPCQMMRQEVFGDEEGAAAMNDFLAVQVADEDHSKAADAIRAHYITTALPTLIVTSSRSKQPYVLAGYGGRDKTINFLRDSYYRASRR